MSIFNRFFAPKSPPVIQRRSVEPEVEVRNVSSRTSNAKYILIANSKGGAGKSTLAINLASVYAVRGFNTALMDYDSQGSSTEWTGLRTPDMPAVHCIDVCNKNSSSYTHSWATNVPRECERIVIDTPAKIHGYELNRLIQRAHVILIPVLPSPIDISASAEFIGDVLLNSRFRNSNKQLAVIPNRVRPNTLIYQKLYRFLDSLNLPLLDPLRDSEIYLQSIEGGMGSHELDIEDAAIERRQWNTICDWLEETIENQVITNPSHDA